LQKRRLPYIFAGVKRLTSLMKATSGQPFELFTGAAQVDKESRYKWEPGIDFPFAVKLICFSARRPERPLVWHEYLELFIPLESRCRLRVGQNTVTLQEGDVLVMDNLKLHVVLDFPGSQLRAIVIRFLPGFIYSLGSFSIDYLFCVPFYHQMEGQSHVLRRTDAAAARVHAALAQLVECYFDKAGMPFSQAGAKVFFLEVLYHLARHFQVSDALHSEYLRNQQRSKQFQKLFDWVGHHFGEKISVEQAAAMVGMSRNCFLRAFKAVAGMTWVNYLNHVRLIEGARLLKETLLPIAEIAARMGYADQSYFDRRFKERFGHTPLRFRSAVPPPGHS
jgi:AraC-like DNA-binding protein